MAVQENIVSISDRMSETRVAPNIEEQVVKVSGLRLHTARRRGRISPPLVLVHGIGGSLSSWGSLLDHLPDRDIIMIDAPGAGRSEIPLLPFRVPTIADYISYALRALDVEKADILGYSLGGTVAQEIAHRHPSLVRKLILVGTCVGLGSIPGSVRPLLTLLSTTRYRDRKAAERQMPVLSGGKSAREPAVLKSILDSRNSYPPSWLGYRYQNVALLGWTSLPWLHKLTLPVLVFQGDDDPVVPVINGRILASRLRNAQFSVIGGAGHLVLFDEPEKAAPLIEEFLDSQLN